MKTIRIETAVMRAGTLALVLGLYGCAMQETKSVAVGEDEKVQGHALYDGDVNSAEIKAERYKTTRSGTNFDKKNNGKKGTEIAQAEKQEHIDKADTEYRNGNYDVALYEYVRALILDDQDYLLYYKVGVLQAAKGNLQLAELALRKATELEPGYIPALDQYGQLNLRLRRYDVASTYFNRAIERDRERLTKTKTATETTDANSPFNAYNGMGVIEDINTHFDAAQRYYTTAQRIRPDSAEPLNNLGYSLYLQGNLVQAENQFRQAIALDPGFSKAWYNLALIYVRSGRNQEAVALLADKTGDQASANNTVGYLSMLEGKHKQAEGFFSHAIELSPVYFDLAYQNRDRNRLLNRNE